jgi:methylenetetrahydrofolate reductase (NADPH)
VSVTYRGGAESRKRTFDLVTGMLRTTTLVPMAHLICVAHTRLELAEILVAYRTAGVENLMALGGDPPADPDEAAGELQHASELVELASAIGGFSIGVAAQPGGHPLSADRASDRDFLAAKLAGADFAVTQFFFESDDYAGLVADLAERGVDKPVLPGIMPVTSLRSVPRMAAMGAAVPEWMVARLEAADRSGGAEAVRHEGVAIATELCRQLLDAGVPGLHFYTLNRSSATREIYSALGLAAP